MMATHESAELACSREEVVHFGTDQQVMGIICRPSRTTSTSIVILNAGVLHRVGPHRLHVNLARRLADHGVFALRLDLGGIGDSVASSDAPTFRESAVNDTVLALAGITEVRRHVIFGLCAGADNALATALVDQRVAGVVLVDPHCYATLRAQLRELGAQLRRRGPRALLGMAAVAARRVRARFTHAHAPPPGREPPPVETFRAQLHALVDRGVRVLAIFSGIHGAKYNHADQLFELFPELRGKVERAYFPAANHTFTELDAQAELIATVTAWFTARFE